MFKQRNPDPRAGRTGAEGNRLTQVSQALEKSIQDVYEGSEKRRRNGDELLTNKAPASQVPGLVSAWPVQNGQALADEQSRQDVYADMVHQGSHGDAEG